MEEQLHWNSSHHVTPDQNLCCLPPGMFPIQNKMAAIHSAPSCTFSSLAWGGVYPVGLYQHGMTIPFGVSVCAEPVSTHVMRRAPPITGPMIHWPANNRSRSLFPAALNPPLTVALRTPIPASLNVPRRFSSHRTPGASVVHEKVSFVEPADYSSFQPERAQLPVRAGVPGASTSIYRDMAAEWHQAVDAGYMCSEAHPCTNYNAIPLQFGGVMYDIAESSATSDVNSYYTSQEVRDGCPVATADDCRATGPAEKASNGGDNDGRGEWDETCQSCSEEEDEIGEVVEAASCDADDSGGSDAKTREAVSNLLTIMAEERRSRRWRRLANRRVPGKRPTEPGNMNETVRKLISFTRMRCPYQEPERACNTVQPPNRACMSVKSVFWASDDYIQETTYAVKVLLEKY